jgi:hypothetical protein
LTKSFERSQLLFLCPALLDLLFDEALKGKELARQKAAVGAAGSYADSWR